MRLLKKFKCLFQKKLRKNEHLPVEKRVSVIEIKPSTSLHEKDIDVDLTSLTILAMDDNPHLLDIVKTFLEMQGIAVDVAVNGQIGLEHYLLAPEKYDLILTDIEMPVMGGIETAKSIRESGCASCKTIPIIAFTGSMFSDDPRMPLFDGLINKPFEMEKLASVIRRTLIQRQIVELNN